MNWTEVRFDTSQWIIYCMCLFSILTSVICNWHYLHVPCVLILLQSQDIAVSYFGFHCIQQPPLLQDSLRVVQVFDCHSPRHAAAANHIFTWAQRTTWSTWHDPMTARMWIVYPLQTTALNYWLLLWHQFGTALPRVNDWNSFYKVSDFEMS